MRLNGTQVWKQEPTRIHPEKPLQPAQLSEANKTPHPGLIMNESRSKIIHVRLIGDSKLVTRVSMLFFWFLVAFISLLALWGTDDQSRVYTASHLMVAGIGSRTPKEDKPGMEKVNKWMILRLHFRYVDKSMNYGFSGKIVLIENENLTELWHMPWLLFCYAKSV